MTEARSVPECEASSWLWLWRVDILGFGALVGFLLALSRLELEFVHGGERHQRTWPHVLQLLLERIASSGQMLAIYGGHHARGAAPGVARAKEHAIDDQFVWCTLD